MTPLKRLHEQGQSYWIDDLTRELLRSGELRRRAVCAAIDSAVRVRRLAVRCEPRSGPPSALLDMCGISRRAIVEAAEDALRVPASR
jgi:hypothetical protein